MNKEYKTFPYISIYLKLSRSIFDTRMKDIIGTIKINNKKKNCISFAVMTTLNRIAEGSRRFGNSYN